MGTRGRSGNPAARSVGQSDPAVERSRELERYMRPALRLPAQKTCHRSPRDGRSDSAHDRDTCGFQRGNSSSIGTWIRVVAADDDACRPRRRDELRAGWAARGDMRARFERGVERCPRNVASGLHRSRLGMRSAAGLGPAPSDDLVVPNDDAADRRIGSGPPASSPGQRRCRRDPARIARFGPILPPIQCRAGRQAAYIRLDARAAWHRESSGRRYSGA